MVYSDYVTRWIHANIYICTGNLADEEVKVESRPH